MEVRFLPPELKQASGPGSLTIRRDLIARRELHDLSRKARRRGAKAPRAPFFQRSTMAVRSAVNRGDGRSSRSAGAIASRSVGLTLHSPCTHLVRDQCPRAQGSTLACIEVSAVRFRTWAPPDRVSARIPPPRRARSGAMPASHSWERTRFVSEIRLVRLQSPAPEETCPSGGN